MCIRDRPELGIVYDDDDFVAVSYTHLDVYKRQVFLLSPEHIATSNGEAPKQGESGSFFVSATA